MSSDLFISYSRRDNANGRITELKNQIEGDYRAFSKQELHCFFDQHDIHTNDDWQHTILQGLSESSLLLLVLSPAYLDSPHCEWEIVEFLKYEHARSVGGQGVTPVYFVEVPGLDDPEFETRAAAWIAQVSRRNRVDLRPWFQEGMESLKRKDVRERLDDLRRSLNLRLTRLRSLRNAPGNLKAHNPRFVGRETEMQRLHEKAGLGRFGVLTAVQGLGGVGKTALAIQYAYAYADFYPGGRWLVGCAGETSLASALRLLAVDLKITLDETEKRDDDLAARRVLADLERRAVEGAQARSAEENPPQPKALLLLDNVDTPQLLQPPQSDLLTGRDWLHVLATTRSAPEEFGSDPDHVAVLTIDHLPEADALRLVESYQPDGRFSSPQERVAARELVNRLECFTLAVEVAAVFLGECAGRVTCAALLERVKKEGLQGIEGVAGSTKRGIGHGEKLLGPTLKPTLDLLSPQERLVLSYAALLPPDTIPFPWLRALAAKEYPELGQDAAPGYPDSWLGLINHLLGLRLLQTVDLADDNRTPRLARMHRLVGELVRGQEQPDSTNAKLLENLVEHALSRSESLEDNWFQQPSKWEIHPLVTFVEKLLSEKHPSAPKLVKYIGEWFVFVAEWNRAESIFRNAISFLESQSPTDELEIAILCSNLSYVYREQGRYSEAETQVRRALEIDDRLREPTHPFIAIRLKILYGLLKERGNLVEAESCCRRSLDIDEKHYGTEHRSTIISMGCLASLLEEKGDFSAAEPLYRRQLEFCERQRGPEHPDTLTSVSNLASMLAKKGDYAGAQSLYKRALEARERVLGREHPDTLMSVGLLACLLDQKCDYLAAEALYRRVLEDQERVLGREHPGTLVIVNNLALLLQNIGRNAEAEPLFCRSMDGRRKAYGLTHPNTANGVVGYAMALVRLNRDEEAARYANEALNIWSETQVPDEPRTGKAHWVLGTVAARRGDTLAARQHLADALRLLRKGNGEDHPWIVAIKKELEELNSKESKAH